MRAEKLNRAGAERGAAVVALPGCTRPRALEALADCWREVVAACGSFEWATLAYFSAVNLLLLLFGHNLPGPYGGPGAWFYILRHALVGFTILLLAWSARRWPHGALRWARSWYPHLVFLFCFEELHYLARLVFPEWFDRWLIAFDYGLFGAHPTLWLERFAAPALNDLMQAAYMTYFFYLVVLGAALYRQREWRAYWAVMTSTAVAYYAGYFTGIVFPIESPHHTLAAMQTVALEGGWVTALINWIEGWGRVHGGAFPSAHVSGSFVALLGAWRYRRGMFWVFLPLFLAMLVSTVYGRYHYVADVFGGLLYGGLGFWLGHKLVRPPRL